MRKVVGEGLALGLFVEGSRQRSGVPGEIQAGAAMVGLQEGVPIVPVAVHGSQTWKPFNFHPVSIAFGEPLLFDGLPKGGKGYKEASALLQARIQELFEFLVEMHELGRPDAVPPRYERDHGSRGRARRRRGSSPARSRSSASPTWASRP